MRIPTKKRIEQSNQLGFLPATDDFFDVIVAASKGYYKKFFINFKQINAQLGKSRRKGSYATSHVINVRRQILACPIVKVINKHSPWCFEVAILPFDKVQKSADCAEKMNAVDVAVEPRKQDTEANLEQLSDDRGIEQQQLIQTKQLCESVGIKYQPEDLVIIASFGIEAVKASVEYFKEARLTSDIRNAAGWLRSCLRRKFYLNEKATFTPINKLIEQFHFVLNEYGTIPSEIFNFLTTAPPPNQLSLFSQRRGSPSINN